MLIFNDQWRSRPAGHRRRWYFACFECRSRAKFPIGWTRNQYLPRFVCPPSRPRRIPPSPLLFSSILIRANVVPYRGDALSYTIYAKKRGGTVLMKNIRLIKGPWNNCARAFWSRGIMVFYNSIKCSRKANISTDANYAFPHILWNKQCFRVRA